MIQLQVESRYAKRAKGGLTYEEEIWRGTDRRCITAFGARVKGQGPVPGIRCFRDDAIQLEGKVWWDDQERGTGA